MAAALVRSADMITPAGITIEPSTLTITSLPSQMTAEQFLKIFYFKPAGHLHFLLSKGNFSCSVITAELDSIGTAIQLSLPLLSSRVNIDDY